ncbi:MAG: hypothetical protein [Cressdnaviricota sp.]|nr:MAG: hypothetical protein [Cressdnaviricota sp.]
MPPGRSKNSAARIIQRNFRKRRRKKKQSAPLATINKKLNLLLGNKTYFDSVSNTNVTASGDFVPMGLAGIIKGTGQGQRTGDHIMISSIQLSGVLSVLNSALINDDAFNNIRLMAIMISKPNTLNAPMVSDNVLQDGSFDSFYKKNPDVQWSLVGKFDREYYLDNQGFGSGAASNPIWTPVKSHQARIRHTIRFPKGLKVTYNNSGDIISNDIRLFTVSDSNASGHPGLIMNYRINYQP